jgi:hypothetical protein
MTDGIRRFLWGLGVWEFIMIAVLLVIDIRSGAPIHRDALWFEGPAVLFGVIVVWICSRVARKAQGFTAVVVGVVIGATAFAACAFLWAICSSGFEYPAVFFANYLLLAVPSGIAGGIVGWLNRGRDDHPVGSIGDLAGSAPAHRDSGNGQA